MTGALSADQVTAYQEDGFLFPLQVFPAEEARGFRAGFEALEQRYADGGLPRPLGRYLRVNAHIVIPLAAQIASDPRVLDRVESILGPDLLVWSAELFIKEPQTPHIVSWHQDLTYWGLGETDQELTAWIALSPATVKSGCMRFVAGSHKQRIQPHNDTFSDDNLLSRGQEIAVVVNEDDASNVILEPGQLSLHHGRMFHASGPNQSDDRRIGVAVRFVTPEVRQMVAERDYAMLVRGADPKGNMRPVAPPKEPFDPPALDFYEAVLADQATALSQGAKKTVTLYD